jgi:hypothetical protein
MKGHGVRWGQTILTPAGPARIVALVISPRETVVVSGDGFAPGHHLDPEVWSAAEWDARRQQWVVPATPGAA